MILSNAENIIVNGVLDPDIFVNSVQVWPSLGALEFYRVYIKWSPAKAENLTFQGLGWNGNPGTLTTSMLLDAQKSKNGYQYTAMTEAEQSGICDTSTGVYRDWETDRNSTRLNSSHITRPRMPSSA